jgi:single-stranded-DNA-specific exonuclease
VSEAALPKYQWVSREKKFSEKEIYSISNKFGLHPIAVRVLRSRGIETSDEIKAYIHPKVGDILPPSSIPGLDVAVNRLRAAALSHEPVLVHGDYDVDGIVGSVILHETLKQIGCESKIYLPDREVDGYGLSLKSVDMAKNAGIKLIVSVDCGISSHETVAKAIENGIEVIITDHHSLPDTLPQNKIHVHPDLEGDYPGGQISGSTVAYKLALELTKIHGGDIDSYVEKYLPMVAVATIADVCPLTGENRIIVSRGMEMLPDTKVPGLKVLVQGAMRDSSGKILSARDIAFGIAPLMNAAGRMSGPMPAAKLLLAKDDQSAWKYYRQLQKFNADRKRLQESICLRLLKSNEIKNHAGSDRIVAIVDETCPPGLTGIISARIADRTGCPSCILTPLETENGIEFRGSMRSSGGIDILNLMQPAKEHVIRMGGHKEAMGVTVAPDKIDDFLHACRELRFISQAQTLEIDVVLESAPDSIDAVKSVDMLGPWGAGNPHPVFAWGPVRIKGSRVVGKTKEHLQLDFHDSVGNLVKGIGFSMAEHFTENSLLGQKIHTAGHFIINSWQGYDSLEFQFVDLDVNNNILT